MTEPGSGRMRQLLGGLLLACVAPCAAAQDYPTRPVRIIVPFAAGGPADVYARFIAIRLQDALGQTFIVDDRPGAGSIIGTDAVAKSAPDGYTLLLMSNTHTVNESLIPTKPFQLMRDFTAVAPINSSDLVLVARSGLPVTTLAELIAAAKAKPGAFSYASSGPGTPYHMAGELFKAMAGVSILHIPYKGSSGARTDVLGGQVDMMFISLVTGTAQVHAGKLRAYGVTSAQRQPSFPDLPAIGEVVKGFESTAWFGVFGPAKLPADITNKLNVAIVAALNDPKMRERLENEGATPAASSAADFAAFVRDDVKHWAPIVKQSGAKME